MSHEADFGGRPARQRLRLDLGRAPAGRHLSEACAAGAKAGHVAAYYSSASVCCDRTRRYFRVVGKRPAKSRVTGLGSRLCLVTFDDVCAGAPATGVTPGQRCERHAWCASAKC